MVGLSDRSCLYLFLCVGSLRESECVCVAICFKPWQDVEGERKKSKKESGLFKTLFLGADFSKEQSTRISILPP